MYLMIIVLPIVGGLIGCNRFSGHYWAPRLACMCLCSSAVFSTLAFLEVSVLSSSVCIPLCSWLRTEYLNIDWCLVYDPLSVSMLLPILYICSLVQLYSLGYMAGDAHLIRFISLLSLFAVSMILLVSGENLLVSFVGWELVGLISYLLVGFWYTRLVATSAALKAFLMNRVGDMAFSLAILLGLALFGDLSYATLFSLASYVNGDLLTLMVLLLIIGGAAKSGQFGFSGWLLSAMEGPTPVSALLHSATMVTAGVFLLLRFTPLLEYSSTGLMAVAFLGGCSALLGAAGGLLENEIKRVIAFSTTSQLAYMFVCIGISQHSVAMFHLLTHAWFKALLFLSAGAVIHAIGDIQDLRKMGGLLMLLPRTYSMMLLGSLSLMALPFSSGFYSKDMLLELLLVPRNTTSTVCYLLALSGALLSATYSTRLLIMAYLARPNLSRTMLNVAHDPQVAMAFPMIILSIAAVVFGYITHDLFLGLGSGFYQQALFIHPNHLALLDNLSAPSGLMLEYLPLLTLLILLTALDKESKALYNESKALYNESTALYNESTKLSPAVRHNSVISQEQYSIYPMMALFTTIMSHFNIINQWVIQRTIRAGVILYRTIDKGFLELVGPKGLTNISHYLAFTVETYSSGFILHYAYIIIISLVTIPLICYLLI